MKIELYMQDKIPELIDFNEISLKEAARIPVTAKLLNSAEAKLQIRTAIPIIDIHGYWTPELFRPKMQLDWRITFNSAAHRNFPFITFFNDNHDCRGAVALTNLHDDAHFTASMNQEKGVYELSIEIGICSETSEFEIIYYPPGDSWLKVLNDFFLLVTNGMQAYYPDAAWNAVFCTWYAAHAKFNEAWLEENAKVAAELDFGTFIVDDGWCFDDQKRVTPDTIGNWYEMIGNWRESDKKLPNFKEHVKKVQNLGLNYLLWVAPFFVGIKSQLYADYDGQYLSEEHEGYQVFDPADQTIAEESMNRMLRLVEDYELDGLKIDFIDSIPQSADSLHGRDVFNYVNQLCKRIKDYKKDALIEFRQHYSTPVMLPLGTQFRAGDVPFDFIENLHRIAQIRIICGDHVPVHADPVYWHANETEQNISRHMMASLTGVPMLSMDLPKLSENQLQIISYWLKFYKDHINTFKNGHWQVSYDFDYLASITVTSDRETIVFLCKTSALKNNNTQKTYILNLSEQTVRIDSAQVFDFKGNALTTTQLESGNMALKL